MAENDAYPMQQAPRCTAHSKRTGLPCKAPAVRGWNVCRMHGARGGAKPGAAHPGYKHGLRSQQARQLTKLINQISRSAI